jgi:hypothetical protein
MSYQRQARPRGAAGARGWGRAEGARGRGGQAAGPGAPAGSPALALAELGLPAASARVTSSFVHPPVRPAPPSGPRPLNAAAARGVVRRAPRRRASGGPGSAAGAVRSATCQYCCAVSGSAGSGAAAGGEAAGSPLRPAPALPHGCDVFRGCHAPGSLSKRLVPRCGLHPDPPPPRVARAAPAAQPADAPPAAAPASGTAGPPTPQRQPPQQQKSPQQQTPQQQPPPQQQQQPARPAVPPRALGVDFGTVWTGLAAAELGRATPLRVVRNADAANRAEFMRALADEAAARGAGGIVVGIPLRPGQRAGDAAADTPHVRGGGGGGRGGGERGCSRTGRSPPRCAGRSAGKAGPASSPTACRPADAHPPRGPPRPRPRPPAAARLLRTSPLSRAPEASTSSCTVRGELMAAGRARAGLQRGRGGPRASSMAA